MPGNPAAAAAALGLAPGQPLPPEVMEQLQRHRALQLQQQQQAHAQQQVGPVLYSLCAFVATGTSQSFWVRCRRPGCLSAGTAALAVDDFASLFGST